MGAAPPGEPGRTDAGVPAADDDDWFARTYPQIVGLVRRVLDRDRRSPASLARAEQVTIEAFSRQRRAGGDERATTAVLRRAVEGCTDELVGHPGSVPVHPDLLGEQFGADDLALVELHAALASMRRADRWVGLVVLAGGCSPSEAAALLQLPLDEVLAHLGRVVTRLEDARRLGLVTEGVGVGT